MNKSDIQETLVSLYLRLNGYFVSGFIVHAAQGAGTEMDILAVRFPRYSEPEREVQPCCHLGTFDNIDFIVGEVKGGPGAINFNHRFRADPEIVRTVLRRFGAFADDEIDRVSGEVGSLLDPSKLNKASSFPELDVTLAHEIGDRQAKLRFVPFAAEQQRPPKHARPYIFQDDLLAFVWKCFRPECQRALCDVRYNFELWGPQYVQMVQYFKQCGEPPIAMNDLYKSCGAKE